MPFKCKPIYQMLYKPVLIMDKNKRSSTLRRFNSAYKAKF